MTTPDSLEKLLARGVDNALLRFGLGKACLDEGEAEQAMQHLQKCLSFDPAYSAAWKLLGQACLKQGLDAEALAPHAATFQPLPHRRKAERGAVPHGHQEARAGEHVGFPEAHMAVDALRGVRGEVIRLHAPQVTLARPTRLVHPRYSIYIAPKEDHLFVIGATEIESNDTSPVSVRSTLELLSAAYTVHSGFAEARVVEMNTQCRPTLPDNLPAIRRCAPRVLQLNGLYRHGFMIAPAVHDAALELLLQGQSPLAARLNLAVQDV